jgi:parallel beta-helix repeat protein
MLGMYSHNSLSVGAALIAAAGTVFLAGLPADSLVAVSAVQPSAGAGGVTVAGSDVATSPAAGGATQGAGPVDRGLTNEDFGPLRVMESLDGSAFTVTVPAGLDAVTLGLRAGPVDDATGSLGVSFGTPMVGDLFDSSGAVTRLGGVSDVFAYEFSPSEDAYGRFSVSTTGLSEGELFDGSVRPIRFAGGSVHVMVRTRLDLDGSGVIDQGDVVAASALLGTADARMDLNGDGAVDPMDLVEIAENIGMPALELADQGFRVVSLEPVGPPLGGGGGVGPGNQLGAPTANATFNVMGGGTALQDAINSLGTSNGDTLLVGAGTYTPSPGVQTLNVFKSLIIKSTGGAGGTIIQSPNQVNGSVTVHLRASNTVFKGFTVQGGGTGILSQDPLGGTLTNQVVAECIVLTASGSAGHGVLFEKTTDSRIDTVSVTRANANGIFLDDNSFRNVVNHCSVLLTETQHGYAIKNSDDNIISHCTTASAAANSVIIVGGDRNVVQDCTLSGHTVDGITMTDDFPGGTGDSSNNNCILRNSITSTRLAAGSSTGTGIWMNSESNGNLVRGNFITGHPENGIAIFNADDNVVEGNFATNNGQGGVIVWDAASSNFAGSRGGRPTNNLIRGNRFYDFPANGGINVRDAEGTVIERNYVESTSGAAPTFGVVIDEPSPPSYVPTQVSDGTRIIGNTFVNQAGGLLSRQATTDTKYYQNRHFGTGPTTIYPPSDVDLDGDVTLGGNYWDGFAAAGNPSRTTPFTDIVVDVIGTRGGGYSDRYPYQFESLGKSASVQFVTPDTISTPSPAGRPEHMYFQGQTVLLEWNSPAAYQVDIFLSSVTAGIVAQQIALNVPNTGFYRWTVPNLGNIADDFVITIVAENQAGSTLSMSDSTEFGIALNGLTMLSPVVRDSSPTSTTFRIHYNDETDSDIFYMTRDRIVGGDFTVLGSNTNRDREYVDITTSATSTSAYQIGISNGGGDEFASTQFSDGLMRLLQSAATQSSFNSRYKIDNWTSLSWLSPPTSVEVDIELFVGNGAYQTIRSGMKDTGYFRFTIPEWATNNAKYRVTFRDAAGSQVGQVESGTFDIVYDTTPGSPKDYFRFYNLLTTQHLYTSLVAERDALEAAVGTWLREPDQGQIWNGLATVNGVKTVPYYRLFNLVTRRHLWTTDRKNGAEETRTLNFQLAKLALYQLSYRP